MKRINKVQRNYMIIGLCTILIIMAVGYAAFASQLRISGTSNINSSFLVKITNIAVSEKIGSASDKTDVTTYNDTSATFGVNLVNPGDSITYDITITNQGTIDAVLKLITKTDTNNSAILFETSGVNEGDELKAGQTATMKVKVTYNSSVTSQPDNLESSLNLELDYEQIDSTVIPRPTITTEELKTLAVTSGDGLYQDETENEKYFYRGSNPNNYIIFNNETWQIISVESDGTIKILKNSSLESKAFDSGSLRDNSSNEAGGTYCAGASNGCNAWAINDNFVNGSFNGTVLKDAEINTYLNGEYYSSITSDKDKIVNHNFNVGGVIADNNNLSKQITDENSYKWNGKIGLITASDYIKTNSNQSLCGNLSSNNSNYNTCKNTSWMINENNWWTLSPIADYTSNAWYISRVGTLNGDYVNTSHSVRPALYLSSSTLLSGTGSSSDPYTIAN